MKRTDEEFVEYLSRLWPSDGEFDDDELLDEPLEDDDDD